MTLSDIGTDQKIINRVQYEQLILITYLVSQRSEGGSDPFPKSD